MEPTSLTNKPADKQAPAEKPQAGNAGWMSGAVERAATDTRSTETGVWSWVSDNVFKPAANTMVVEPHNAITSSINGLSASVGIKPFLSDWENLQVPVAGMHTGEWFAQNISSGLAMAVPYAVAALGTHGTLRFVGSKLGLEGTAAVLLKERAVSTVLGAAAYDGMRKPHEGETRLGNALGGAAGFATFETGGFLSRRAGVDGIMARAVTGVMGGSLQHLTSTYVSTGRLADGGDLQSAAISAGTMNVVLPWVHDGLKRAVTAGSLKIGRSVPVEDYIDHLTARERRSFGTPLSGSATLEALLGKNPWARVRESNAPASVDTGTGSVRVSRGIATPEVVGHELDHVVSSREGHFEHYFQDAAKALSGADREGAWQAYREARIQHELQAESTARRISQERRNASTEQANPESAEQARARILAARPDGKNSYEQLWRQEFESQFEPSRGSYRPKTDFSSISALVTSFDTLQPAEKTHLARHLDQVSETSRKSTWNKLLRDADAGVRQEAVANLSLLPENQRYNAWRDAVHHADYGTRTEAIKQIASLPNGERFTAWKHVLEQRSILIAPKEAAPAQVTGSLQPNPAAENLVQSIEKLPVRQRFDAWKMALNEPLAHNEAVGHLDVVPPDARSLAWNTAWNSYEHTRPADAGGRPNVLLSQLALLSDRERMPAWNKFVQSGHLAEGPVVAEALRSLPVPPGAEGGGFRHQQWQRLLDRVTEQDASARGGHTRTSDRGVAGGIAALPETMQSSAWQQAFDKLGTSRAQHFADVIPELTPQARIHAFETLAKVAPTERLNECLLTIPEADWGRAMEAVLNLPSTFAEKADMIRHFPLWHLATENPEVAAANARKVLEAVAASPDVSSSDLRNLWNRMPEPDDPVLHVVSDKSPIRELLAKQMPVEALAKIVFAKSGEDAVGQEFARRHPDVVRSMAANLMESSPSENLALHKAAEAWLGTRSLPDAALAAAESFYPGDRYETVTPADVMLRSLAATTDAAARTTTLQALRELMLDTHQQRADVSSIADVAAAIGHADQAQFDAQFIKPMETAVADKSTNYHQRLALARELGRLSREGKLGGHIPELPDLRMPALDIPEERRVELRQKFEGSLRDPDRLFQLFGDGELGRLFPQIFGNHSEGGMIGRPQHEGHEFPVDGHTKRVMEAVLGNPEFATLSPVDQTNVLLAALMHDTGKRASIVDPGHEWVSGNLTWGVMRTLGYSPVQIQRVANLVSRHSELSFNPHVKQSEVLADKSAAQDLAVYYRHESAVKQLAILNEADIKSLDGASSKWTSDVQAELRAISTLIGRQARELRKFNVPLVTSELPQRFTVGSLSGDYAVFGHASPYLWSKFLQQLSVIESPRYSISTTLLTPAHQTTFHGQKFVAIINAASEQIAQAGRSDLGTGKGVDWHEHVQLATQPPAKMIELLAEVDTKLRRLHEREPAAPASVRELSARLAEFNSLDEVQRRGTTDPLYKAHRILVDAITKLPDGKPLPHINEVKLVDGTFGGLGILRRGAPVAMEGLTREQVGRIMGGETPLWVVSDAGKSANTITVPSIMWKELQQRRLPILSLD